MKKTKKMLALLAGSAMMISSLAGCGQSPSAAQGGNESTKQADAGQDSGKKAESGAKEKIRVFTFFTGSDQWAPVRSEVIDE